MGFGRFFSADFLTEIAAVISNVVSTFMFSFCYLSFLFGPEIYEDETFLREFSLLKQIGLCFRPLMLLYGHFVLRRYARSSDTVIPITTYSSFHVLMTYRITNNNFPDIFEPACRWPRKGTVWVHERIFMEPLLFSQFCLHPRCRQNFNREGGFT